VPRWSPALKAEATSHLRRVLTDVGDPAQERLFRMNVTLCLHRAASIDERRQLPSWFIERPWNGLAGGPVEVLWENVPGAISTKPCHRPRKRILDPRDPLLWLPVDCGVCPPCQARARC
jgi:hypothetical protein